MPRGDSQISFELNPLSIHEEEEEEKEKEKEEGIFSGRRRRWWTRGCRRHEDPDRALPPDMNAIGRRRNDDDDDDDDWERLSLPNLMPIVSSISSHHTLTVVRYDIDETARENFFQFGQCGSPCLK